MISPEGQSVQYLTDLEWPWRKEPGPRYRIPRPCEDAFDSFTDVDPFPCYPHERAVVVETFDLVRAACPIDPEPIVYVLSHEPFERTNGWAEARHVSRYDDDQEKWVREPAAGSIVLAGKRIPPHPAVTRYLVAHEYGHHVEYAIARARGIDEDTGVRDEYAQRRGHDERPAYYGGATWHLTAGELLANDFRILVARVESEFWPHPGVPHPATVDGLAEWWQTAVEEIRP